MATNNKKARHTDPRITTLIFTGWNGDRHVYNRDPLSDSWLNSKGKVVSAKWLDKMEAIPAMDLTWR
jgi:hypothetical protein